MARVHAFADDALADLDTVGLVEHLALGKVSIPEVVDAAIARTEQVAGPLNALAAECYDRAYRPEGMVRQMAAIMAGGSRADGLRALAVPTLVIHGLDDTLIAPSGGERTAELVPGAQLLLVPDMGHDRPEPLWPVLADAIVAHTA